MFSEGYHFCLTSVKAFPPWPFRLDDAAFEQLGPYTTTHDSLFE
jgi:hypothetical protein